jgi:hypothetical protein
MMRSRNLVGLVVLGVLFVAAGAVAAEAVPDAEHAASNWTVLVVAVLGAVGVLDRLGRWACKYRRLLLLACELIERLVAQGSMDADTIKGQMKDETEKLPREDREIITKVSSKAERNTNRNGTATRTLQEESKPAKVARWLGRFLPVVGRFL